jgi:hypothetical protein
MQINPHIYGGFVEMIRDFVNGPLGIWSQDFIDRGFDYPENYEKPKLWDKYGASTQESAEWHMMEGGYNRNGTHYLRMKTTTEQSLVGISQMTYVSDYVSSSLYIWAKSEYGSVDLRLRLINPLDDKILLDTILGKTNQEWQKFSMPIPGFQGIHKYQTIFYFDGKGSVDLDEASLMPDNNVNGVRKEYYDLFDIMATNRSSLSWGWLC